MGRSVASRVTLLPARRIDRELDAARRCPPNVMERAIQLTTIWGNPVLDVVEVAEHEVPADVDLERIDRGETIDLERRGVVTRIKAARRVAFDPHRRARELDYAWLNAFVVVFFAHALGVASFVSTPDRDAL